MMFIDKLVDLGTWASNCYIVGTEVGGLGMVVDAGDEPDKILRRIEDLRLTVKIIVSTHAHIDHVNAVREVKEATGAEFAIYAEDAASFRERVSKGGTWGVPKVPPVPDRLLKDGDTIDVNGLHFSVLHTPGHLPGCICILGEGVVFTGDTLFNGSIGRYDLPGGSRRQIMDSIRAKLMVLPDNTIVYPGHGQETTIGDERQYNPFLRRDYTF